jgi:fatty-acyl-CoA synthase
MQTYAELLESLAEHPDDPCQDFVATPPISRSRREVLAAARERGAGLRALGLDPGDRVGLMVSEPEEFLPLMHGALLHGLVGVPIYPPRLFGKAEAHRAVLDAILKAADAHVLLVSDGASRRLGAVPGARVVEVSQLPSAEAAMPASLAPGDLTFLQFTSGSTGTPKGVCVSHGALMANTQAIMVDGLNAGASDRGVSWLPLYHDMGLIGFGLAPPLTRTAVTFIPTWRFIRSPSIWLKTISEQRGTISFAPNFAYAISTRRVAPEGLDLGSMRMWGCAAEPIAPAILDAFEQRFAPSGMKPGQISPCYGLAEATLAVTFTPPSAGRVVDEIDSDQFEREAVAEPARIGRTSLYVSCGKPLLRHEVKIVDEAGHVLPERRVGEIVLRGPSVNAGYFRLPEASARVFRADGLHTGDLGYLANGELYVTGRKKDLIIVAGRNYDPGAIEAQALTVPGVRLAVAVNFTTPDGDALGVLVERTGSDDERLAEAVRASIAAAIGIHAARVVCLAVGSLPKTTSGKLKRAEARRLLQRGPDATP